MSRLIALGLAMFAVGCAQKEEEDQLSPPSSLFSAEDLEKGRTSIDDEEDIAYSINGEDAFYANAPEYSSAADLNQACIDERFNALKVSADTVNIEIKGDLDFTDCPAPDYGPDTTVAISKAVAKVRMWFGCASGDVEGLDGKTIAELDEVEDRCGENMAVQVITNLQFEQAYTQTGANDDGTAYALNVEMKMLNAMQTASGKPCDFSYSSSLYTISDKCDTVSKLTYTAARTGSSSSYATENYTKVGYRSIAYAADGEPRWYSSGNLAVTLNNWDGTITYSAPDVAPTYSFTDGTSTVEGTVGNVGSGLTGSTHQGRLKTHLHNAFAKARAHIEVAKAQ